MSHYTQLQTQMHDEEVLLEALSDLGFHGLVCSEKPVLLSGWDKQFAEIKIPESMLDSAFSDIGFKRQSDGSFKALIADYDRRKYGLSWINKLTQRYAYRKARKTLSNQDFTLVEEEVDQDGSIRLVVRRMA